MADKKIVIINKQSYGESDSQNEQIHSVEAKKFYFDNSISRRKKKNNFKLKWQNFCAKFKRWTRTKQATRVLIFAIVTVLAVSAVLIWGAISKVNPNKYFNSYVTACICENVDGVTTTKYDSMKLSYLEKEKINKKSAKHYQSFELTTKSSSGKFAIQNLYFMLYSQETIECEISITIIHHKFTNNYENSRIVTLMEDKTAEFSIPLNVVISSPNKNTKFILEFNPINNSTAIDIANMKFVS